MDVISRYNKDGLEHAIGLMQKEFKSLKRLDSKNFYFSINEGDEKLAHFKVAWGRLNVVRASPGFVVGDSLDAFEILCKYRFSSNGRHAYDFLLLFYGIKDIPYVRIGDDYFEKDGDELLERNKATIRDDHGSDIFPRIPKFTRFCMRPDNINYSPVHGGYYNMYNKIPWVASGIELGLKALEDKIPWSLNLLRHLFQGHYEKGLEYMQVLYRIPTQPMPILVFASKDRETGKSTFGRWLQYIYQKNIVVTDVTSMKSQFNSIIAEKLVIVIEETESDSKDLVNKLKKLSTDRTLTVNKKHVSEFQVDFFGKFIIMTNEPDRFLSVDKEETRFFINTVPKIEKKDDNIYDYLMGEIPMFLGYLSLLPLGKKRGRMWFAPDEIETEQLLATKTESATALEKDILMYLDAICEEHPGDEFVRFTHLSFYERFFGKKTSVTPSRVARTLKDMGIVNNSNHKWNGVWEGSSGLGRHIRYANKYFLSELGEISQDIAPF